MKSYLHIGCLIVSLTCVTAGEKDLSQDLIGDKFREMLNRFESNVQKSFRQLHTKSYADKEFVNGKLDAIMSPVRSKRDTETPTDIQTQLSNTFQNLQKMFDEAKNSDSAKSFLDKLNEFGTSLQSAGQQFGSKVQETLGQITKPKE